MIDIVKDESDLVVVRVRGKLFGADYARFIPWLEQRVAEQSRPLRFVSPELIVGWIMTAVAGFALAVDIATALLLWAMAKGSLNVRAAFIHNVTDALGSVAVLLGAALVIWLGWTWVDPLLTLLIAGYVLYQVATMLPRAARILMEGSPPDMDLGEVERAMCRVDDVAGIHHLHVWQLDEQRIALEAHVVLSDEADLDATKCRVKAMLADRFDIAHSTLELECEHCGESDDESDC